MSVAGIDVPLELDRAEQALRIGRHDLALEITAKVLTAEPDHAGAHYLMSRAECLREQPHQALESIVKAVRLQPEEPLYLAFHGVLLGAVKKNTEADKAFQQALRMDPDHDLIHYWYAEFLLQNRQQPDRALDHIQRALELDPGDADYYTLHGRILWEKKKPKAAREAFQTALRLDPEGLNIHYNYGLFLLNQNRPKPAFQHLREAVRIDPGDPDIRETFLLSLKAKHPVYRPFRSWALFMSRMGRWRWLLIIGLFIFLRPLFLLHLLFVILFWMVDPLFNFLVRRGWIK
ncbi:tetratricopeptide repeat protein [Kroppenstedtia eburnea]|uniref:Tetratricopeptide repeat-containing protein n=2 Tax=Kroppenstedtia eburnea TaxID=714067 RepID=A0A1N7QAI9_9BACL|nr:tetratricopeptide repeat protein [Kroppenstedtia eburnea]QKI81094.1 tetratricopeptide repeat protein [Kroppenstedtia eburnea]SIT19824.1 Tetratricopeptide repeat-containing protein [Kroppenstedtia eburnea]